MSISVLTKDESVKSDNYAMTHYGIPSQILMENAARSAAQILTEYIKMEDEICILCGSGNNGGDGFALARHLDTLGFGKISVLSIAELSKMSNETKVNYEICQKMNLKVIEGNPEIITNELNQKNYNCYIEALIGVGGSENLRGDIIKLLDSVNSKIGFKVAIDMPAGMNSDTGKKHNSAFRANLIITMLAPKVGFFLNNNKNYFDEIRIASLGLNDDFIRQFASAKFYETHDIEKMIGKREMNSSKFDYGQVLIIAGSRKYPGAAALTANAATRCGSGLVYLASTAFHNALAPEIIQIHLKSDSGGFICPDNFGELSKMVEKCSSIAIGPGIGDEPETLTLIRNIVEKFPDKKFVIDADAIKAFTANDKLNMNVILTPHIYEFARLTKIAPKDISENYYELTKHYAGKMNCIIHLKSVPAITFDGKRQVITTIGNPGMASGGSGDVLTGIFASLSARGLSQFEAASLGSFVHAKSGDIAAEKFSQNSMIASDIIECLKWVV
ncbi:MAG: NAD(P)H-hydrate dehydratase [Candidatus Kapabacteria bacterium]|nr:NAD(P)H-hydrate dehydratase [Ignavibacteriota bacterium]MCW5886031.1 NAD(P)H-hydrate dehydratase [Candidatus Kapabacteria bacterium]